MNGDGQGDAAATQTIRPFYFMVPFWGERYRNYFLDFCLASMLAPNNLGLLRAEDGHRFLIATTREDWQSIEHSPLMDKLRAHAMPMLVEIDKPAKEAAPGGVAAIIEQNASQRKLVEIAFRDRAYGSLLLPDIIVSDGMVAALLRSVRAGHRLVLCGALRQTQESVLAELDRLGYLPADAQPALTGQPVTIPPRVVADLAVRYLHWEVTVFDADKTKVPYNPPFLYWHTPRGGGVVLHTFHAVNVLLDYGAIETHDTDCLDAAILEDIYVGRNFSRCGRIHVVEDSDEFGVLSLTPVRVGQRHNPFSFLDSRLCRAIAWRCNLRRAMAWHAGKNRDTVRRDLFRASIRLHAGDLDKTWAHDEQRIEALIDSAVGDYYPVSEHSGQPIFPRFPSPRLRYLIVDLAYLYWRSLNAIRRLWFFLNVIIGALRGNHDEWARIGRGIDRLAMGCRKRAARLFAVK